MFTEDRVGIFLTPEQKKLVQDEISKMADSIYNEESKLRDKLTKKQFREALGQAIASGDFMAYVRVEDGAQTVIYEPFREVEMLKTRIKELEEEVELLKDPPYA